MLTEDGFRWAEALAIERMHGDDAPRWVAERINALTLAQDRDGVERFRAIAARLAELRRSRERPAS